MPGLRKAIFLDKDGTLVRDVPYNINPALVEIEPSTIEGLKRFAKEDYMLIVISNQSGVALGLFDERDLLGVWKEINRQLRYHGLTIDAFYHCPHHPDGTVEAYRKTCNCRKPLPGLLFRAAADYQIDLSRSWMIGDILHDVEAGNRAGCRTILIDNGNETEWLQGPYRKPDATVKDLKQASEWVMQHSLV